MPLELKIYTLEEINRMILALEQRLAKLEDGPTVPVPTPTPTPTPTPIPPPVEQKMSVFVFSPVPGSEVKRGLVPVEVKWEGPIKNIQIHEDGVWMNRVDTGITLKPGVATGFLDMSRLPPGGGRLACYGWDVEAGKPSTRTVDHIFALKTPMEAPPPPPPPPVDPLPTNPIRVSPGDNIQDALNRGGPIVFRPGTYGVSQLRPRPGARLIGEPGAILRLSSSDKIINVEEVQNVTIESLSLVGEANSGGNMSALIFGPNCHGLTMKRLALQGGTNHGAIMIYHSNNITLEDSEFRDCPQNAFVWLNSKGEYSQDPANTNVRVVRNKFYNFGRMGAEIQHSLKGLVFEYNEFYDTRSGEPVVSIVGMEWPNNTGFVNSIRWNKVKNAGWAYELDIREAMVAANIAEDVDWAFGFADCPDTIVENNLMIRVNRAFGEDGGFRNSQYVGRNMVNGQIQTGWRGPTTRPTNVKCPIAPMPTP